MVGLQLLSLFLPFPSRFAVALHMDKLKGYTLDYDVKHGHLRFL